MEVEGGKCIVDEDERWREWWTVEGNGRRWEGTLEDMVDDGREY